SRVVSTAAAFGFYALFPEHKYSFQLYQTTLDLYNPLLGFYEGFYEESGKPVLGFTSTTNSIILQSLLYRIKKQKPLVVENNNMKSPWWRAVAEGNSGNGLPEKPQQKIRPVSEKYWTSGTGQITPIISKEEPLLEQIDNFEVEENN
ncbi:MAG: DUF3131 domain-containing protein, partial [Sphaerospermopsis sp.]|nr:DUF3131 domain-containing protein [Sphaerospermopsis sp.]